MAKPKRTARPGAPAKPSKRQATGARGAAAAPAGEDRKSIQAKPDGACPIVALGTSAGGLEVLSRFLEAMPPNSGMAFVLIQHLDPEHESMMAELLGSHTTMPVAAAADGMGIEPDHVYVIPPRSVLTIRERRLHLDPQKERALGRMPIDAFFRSLAEDQGEKAICIVLTGTGTDGTLGLKTVKEKGGLVIVQDPDEAPHGGMPRSAIATGMVDLILPVTDMPAALIPYVRHHYFRAAGVPEVLGDKARDALPAILDFLKDSSPVNFDLYKEGTLLRRIERRMGLNHIRSGKKYLELLREDPHEAEDLCKDLLITVTSFFRDPEVFAYLETHIIPGITRRHGADEPIRVWVAGCASGEEAYSLAMLLAEQVATAGRRKRVQIFASDVDEQALAVARAGVYPASIEAEVPRERLGRFFVKEDDTYRVLPELREMIVFANHDLLSDAPFSKLDLVLCRNVLIYLNPNVQGRVIALFHFALRRDGVLVLGASETLGDQTDLFRPMEAKLRCYRRITFARPSHFELPIARARRKAVSAAPEPGAPRPSLALGELTRRKLIEQFAPAAVLVNAKNEAFYFSGPVDAFLKVPAGEASRDVIAMLRNGLQAKVRRAVAGVSKSREPAVIRDAFVVRGGDHRRVTVRVDPVDHEGANFLLITFTEEPKEEAEPSGRAQAAPEAVQNYERELEETRRELQSTIRDLERANEELKAANEEAMSMNEEFQSTNEELETSKEELQSLNEELTTLNNQLQEKVEEQRRTANDLKNLLTSSDIAAVFLDRDMRIRQFTQSATALFNLVPADVGRPLTDINWNIEDPSLIEEAHEVLKTLSPRDRNLKTDKERWFTRRILPYRTKTDAIEGIVITLFDITTQKVAETDAQTARAFYESIVDTVREPLIVLDRTLRVVKANRAYGVAFAAPVADIEGQSIFEVEHGRWDIPGFRTLLEQVVPGKTTVEDYAVEAEFKDLGRRIFLLNARRVRPAENAPEYVLLALLDVTERERRRVALEEHTARLSSILASLPAAVINVDDRGLIISFSPGAERIFGYSADEATGKRAAMLVPEPERSHIEDCLGARRRSGKEKMIRRGREITGRRKDGSAVPLMLDVTETHVGDVRVFTGALRDLTEQKDTEEELRQARKMEVMGRLVGGVAHDFNNLLTIILGNLEMLARSTSAADDRKMITAALEAAQLAANLTHQMLVFARRRKLSPTRVDPNTLVPEIAEMIRRMIDERIRVSTRLEEGTPAIYADEATLRAALLNLAVNARDAMLEGGEVTISTETVKGHGKQDAGQEGGPSPGAYVRIAVSDTGVGMSHDLLERVSEPFFTTKEVGKGSGLGLSMVYGFAHKSGGRIEIDSRPGRGTTVSILLPAMEGEPAAPPAGAIESGDHPGGTERILLVEDDPRVREVTVMKLKMLGYEVLEAGNGRTALDLLAKGEAFNLLFTDEVMPGGMSGSDLAREMRRQRPGLPVLFTSGYGSHKLALEPGDVLLEKPYGIEQLARKVREVLDAGVP